MLFFEKSVEIIIFLNCIYIYQHTHMGNLKPQNVPPSIHNMPKTCMTWTENMSRNTKGEKNWAKGRLGGGV